MATTEQPLSRDALEQRLRQLIIDLDHYRLDCLRYTLSQQEAIVDLSTWAMLASEDALAHAERMGIIKPLLDASGVAVDTKWRDRDRKSRDRSDMHDGDR